MLNTLSILPFMAPAGLCVVAALAWLEPGRRPRRVFWASRAATAASLLLAAISALLVAMHGPIISPLLGADGIGLSVRLDALSAVMFALVAFIGLIVVQYSRNYLDGDPRQGAFLGGLCLTLAAVLLLVLSGNLVQLVAGWIATSVALQRLLLFYRNRSEAAVAARKKFIVSRVGEVCLIVAAVLLSQAFATADIGAILEKARVAASADEIPAAAQVAAVLLAVAALLKSAQFPTHGWLPEVMETPTPVSALLHAGIINAGGFLVIRLADVMLLCAPSMHLLAFVGGFTALFGSLVMLTQTSVKLSLAYSTVAQMGFMLFQCGLGAFSVAVLHIVAHSLYKAHAFLSSGSVAEIVRAPKEPIADYKLRRIWIFVSFAGALAVFVGVGALLGVSVSDKPAIMALGAILIMGLTHLLAQAMKGNPNGYVIGRTFLAAAAVAFTYFVLEIGAEMLLASALPITPRPNAVTISLMALVVGSFGLVALLQLVFPETVGSPWRRAAYVHISNGFYVNALVNRLIGALRRSAIADA